MSDKFEGKGKKATLYSESGFMGNVVATQVWLREVGRAPYAQYADAPYAIFTVKRKKKVSKKTAAKEMLLVVEGWDAPDPQDPLTAGVPDENTGLIVSQSKYSSYDKRWVTDFNALIDPLIESGAVKVIARFNEES